MIYIKVHFYVLRDFLSICSSSIVVLSMEWLEPIETNKSKINCGHSNFDSRNGCIHHIRKMLEPLEMHYHSDVHYLG